MNFVFPFERLKELNCKRFYVFGASANGAECQRQINANPEAGTNLGFIDNFITNETVKYDIIREVGIHKPKVLRDADFDCIVLGCRKGLIPEIRESLVNLGVSNDKIIEGDYASFTSTSNNEDEWNEYYEKHKGDPFEKFIYYGAGQYLRDNFEQLSSQYDPICFCDREAQEGQTLFGLPVFPPSAIFEKYSGTRVVVALDTEKRLAVQSWLVCEMGVPKERIANYDDETYIVISTCPDLENYLRFNPNENWGRLCCGSQGLRNKIGPALYFSEKDSLFTKMDKLRVLRKKLQTDLAEGKNCVCTDCKMLRQMRVKTSRVPELVVDFAHDNVCNVKCCYCNISFKSFKKKFVDIDLYRKSIEAIRRTHWIDHKTKFWFASGEISVLPQLSEFLDLFSEYNCHFASNCVSFNEVFMEHLKLGKSLINCSVDAGTKETFEKIKGVDCFEQVCENLKSYSKYAKIVLKYIFLPGINDNDMDIDGFIKLVKEIRPEYVETSRNFVDMSEPLSDFTLGMIVKFQRLIKALGIQVTDINVRLTSEERERYNNITEREN